MSVYVEPTRADFWQLAKEREPDGTLSYVDPMGPKDCMTHSAARAVMRATEGKRPAGVTATWPPTGYAIRRACLNEDGTRDTTAGVHHGQVKAAVKRLYGVDLTLFYGNSFDDLVDLSDDTHGVMVSFRYKRFRDSAQYRGSFTFIDNHEGFIGGVDRKRGVFTGVVEPLADGRQPGLHKGPGEYPISLFRAACGELNISGVPNTYRALGSGKAYFAVTIATGAPPTPTVPSTQPHVVDSAPAPSERNVMINANGLALTSAKVIKLASGQPIFRSPGGPRITATSAAGSLPYCGAAGTGWVAVKVRTRGPYADGIVRDTIAYVPASAGPVVAR